LYIYTVKLPQSPPEIKIAKILMKVNSIVTPNRIKTNCPFNFFTWLAKSTFLLLCLFVLPSGAKAQNVLFDSISIIKTISRPEQVIQNISLSGLHFYKTPGNRTNFKMVGSEFRYIVLKLIPAGNDATQYLSIDNTSLDTVCIYRIFNDGTSRMIYQGGELIPYKKNRNYVWHTVEVATGSVPSFYLIALKASQRNINVKYEILKRDELQQKYRRHDRMIFFYIGIVCLVIIVMVMALLLFKKAVFAAYLGYILFASIWILSHYGYLFPYVYPQMPVINKIIKPVSSLAACFLLLNVLNLVFSQQLQSRKWQPLLIKIALYILPLIIVSMLLLLVPNLSAWVKAILFVAWHVALIFSITIIVFTPLSFFNSGTTAKIFSVAMVAICTMVIIQLFANSGFINSFFIEEHGLTMGSVLENIIIAFGLFFNLLQERKQREKQVLALEQEQTETLKKLVTVQDNERKRIAGDLHDNIGPLLAALKINFRRIIHTAEEGLQLDLVNKTESIIDDSISEIRNVAHNLMPKGLSSNGLTNTLQEYFDSIQQLYDKTILFKHQVESILNPDLQINLYRIICELVLNSARHSNASNITVAINADEYLVSLRINDDGQGFQIKPGGKKSLGLQSAESRVLYLKGTFDLQSQAGKGTQIAIDIPL
jgi:signal transduction histidine kinase